MQQNNVNIYKHSRSGESLTVRLLPNTVNLPTNWPLAFLLIFLSHSIPLLPVSIYEHTYGAVIARMTVGDEMSLDSPTSPLLRFLIGPFFAILVHSLSVTVTCSPPS